MAGNLSTITAGGLAPGAARALGLVRESSSLDGLLGALDDAHEEVRAAAVDALGRLGDARSGPALAGTAPQRIAASACEAGGSDPGVGPARRAPSAGPCAKAAVRSAMSADILGVVGASDAIATLLEWSGATDPTVRAAAASGASAPSVSDDRSFFYAFAALTTRIPMCAAWPLEHWAAAAGRQPSVSASHLDDEWLVAAQCRHRAATARAAGSGRARDASRVGRPGRRSRAPDVVGAHVPEDWSLIDVLQRVVGRSSSCSKGRSSSTS